MTLDRIAIVLPVHNRKDTTLTCLRQLHDIAAEGFERKVVVIDDGSTDGTPEAISHNFPEVTLLKGNGSLWWAGALNTGFEYALKKDFDFVYTMNDDIEFFPETLQVLYDTLKDKRDAVCSSMFFSHEKKNHIVYAGFRAHGFFTKMKSPITGPYLDSYAGQVLEADCLSTKSTLIPVEVIKKAGFIDAKRFPHNYSDWDYFRGVKCKGYSLLVNMSSRIYTHGSDSNYHQILLNKDLKDIAKTFFDIKYGNHLRSLYYLATKRESFIKGHLLFVYKLLPYGYWLVFRLLLPKTALKKKLVRDGKIKTGQES